ncbi:MAG: ParB N-terminal domain-containing protein [Polyangiaceae bacterium]
MKVHPYAELFPELDENALRALADDIAKNGLLHPICLLDGQILDGRNRWKACQLAHVEPRTVAFTGSDPVGFVLSMNLRRRQLTPSQLATLGVELEALRAKEAQIRKSDRCCAASALQRRDEKGRLERSRSLGRVHKSN